MGPEYIMHELAQVEFFFTWTMRCQCPPALNVSVARDVEGGPQCQDPWNVDGLPVPPSGPESRRT